MVSLDSIRRRSGLLMVVIGVAMFAFIMMDFMSSKRGGGGSDVSVGEVYGEPVDIQSFEARVQEQVDAQKQNNPNVDVSQVRNSIWNQMVRELVMAKEYEALGVIVGSDELFDMIQGNNPNASVKQAFTNPETGAFDRARLLQYLKEDIDNDVTGQTRARWIQFEQALQQNRQTQKYNSLVAKGLNVSDFEAQANYNFQNEVRNASYIQIPLKTISDSLVDVSDSELSDFMYENSDRFQQDASRAVEYVLFAVNPSAADDKAALAWTNDIKAEFAIAENNETFLRRYSDGAGAPLTYVAKESLAANVASLFDAAEGTVVGPFKQGNKIYRLAKLVASESRPDSVEARHILVTGANAEAAADSLKSLIEGGRSFASLAEANSQDPGSAAKGGDLGWFAEGLMVAEFNEACFTAKKGALQLVNSQFGTHLIEVTAKSRSSKKAKVAYLDRKVEPSNETYSGVFTQAGKFAAENTSAAQFNETVSTDNLSKRIADNLQENTSTITGLDNPRALVRWAYGAKIGEVSDVFTFANKFVIATLTEINEEGMKNLEDVRGDVATSVRNQKRVDMLTEQLQGASSLEELANDYGVSVKTVEGVTFNNNQVAGLGNEPAFVGATFSLTEGAVSTPFAGKSAVFVVRVDNVITAPEGDAAALRQQLATALQSRAGYQAYQSLQDLADVQDNRADFY